MTLDAEAMEAATEELMVESQPRSLLLLLLQLLLPLMLLPVLPMLLLPLLPLALPLFPLPLSRLLLFLPPPVLLFLPRPCLLQEVSKTAGAPRLEGAVHDRGCR